MAQVSTAISDLVLSISSFYGAGVIAPRYIHAAAGLLIIALAAGVGTTRFLNIAPLYRQNAVISLHTKLSWFGAILGVPLLAASFSIKYRSNYGFQLHIITGIAGAMLSILLPKFKDVCTHFASTLAILSILFQSFAADNVIAIAGAILYAVASTTVGTSGYFLGYLRIDIFHYFLAAANIVFVRALQ